MSHSFMKSRGGRRPAAMIVALLFVLGSAYALPGAQSVEKKALAVSDYTRWRTIGEQALSPDGKYVTYVLRHANTPTDESKPVLHLLNLETNTDVEIPDGSDGTFSRDAAWLAYQVTPADEAEDNEADDDADEEAPDDEDTTRRVELRRLDSGGVRSWENVQSFEFSPASTHLVLRRRPAGASAGSGGGRGGGGGGGGGRAGGAADDDAATGVDVIVHDLTTGRDLLLGSVGDVAFNRAGDLLAYTVDATDQVGNGLFVIDLADGRVRTLDNGTSRYTRLAWNDEGTALAVLKGEDVDKHRERDNDLLVVRDVRVAVDDVNAPPPVVLDPAATEAFPADWVVSNRAALEWSVDGDRVFFGIKPQAPDPPSTERDTDKVADVDVWNTVDERIQSVQMRRATADQNRTYQQAFIPSSGAFIALADETMRDLDVAPAGRWAIGQDTRGYIHDYNRPAADFYRVDTATGERHLMFQNQRTSGATFGFSPDGGTYLYWKDDRIHAYDLDAGTERVLAPGDVSFVNTEYDRPGPKPAYGVTGFSADGNDVVVAHRYDLWAVPLDGSAPRNLTGGAGVKDEIRFRYVRTEPRDPDARGGLPEVIDLSQPITLSAYGEYTKKDGFYTLANGALTPLVFEDASFSTPTRAQNAETFLFTRQTFQEFPDLRVSGPGFADARAITDANPQQAEFRWGRRVLFDFENEDGVRLQGILGLPDDYQPGERRPMLVTFYEKNSQNLHRYSAPSYLTGMGSSPMQAVSEGYITMLPDIHFRTGASHSDMLECVEAAVRKVIELGYADPDRIGISGHSYGGEGAAFIGTRSKLFAAVGMGAGVTDIYMDFSQNWGWSYQVNSGSGSNGSDYYLFGQGREAVSPWDDPELYMFESALTHAPEATAPFLIMHGTDDPTVAFFHALGFYNALRFNGKSAILLAYPGEGHGLRGWANRRDLTERFFQFFNHHLKGEPAPAWMTEGVPYLKKQAGGGGG